MFNKYHGFLFLFLFVLAGCFSTKPVGEKDLLPAKELLPCGRSDISNDKLELISSAVHFGFSFEGSRCEVYASLPGQMDHNYLQYEMDGQYQKRVKVGKDQNEPILIETAGKGKHTVWIYKATEASTGPIFIEKISGNHLKSIPISNAPLIEFIGNSITCGADADNSEMPCGQGAYHDYHNAYYAYGPRVARQLGVNYILSSVSGIGIYRTWNREGPSMPQVYDKTDFQASSQRLWDFSKYRPAIVSLALGTNDLSTGDGQLGRSPFDSARFVNNYVGFVRFVKQKYPAAQIVLLNSPMVGGESNVLLENCLRMVKMKIDGLYPSDKAVALFFFTPMKPRGCSWHPSVEDHAILAEELLPFFKGLLNP